jgi:hypothetical protein
MSSAITRNIFIGWDDEPASLNKKKGRNLHSQTNLQSKTPIRNRKAFIDNAILEDEEQKENDFYETSRAPNHGLSKLSVAQSHVRPTHLSERVDNPFRTVPREHQVHSVDKNAKNRNLKLRTTQDSHSKGGFDRNIVRPIENPIQATARKEGRPSMEDDRSIKKSKPRDYSSHLDNRLKLPSFDLPRG